MSNDMQLQPTRPQRLKVALERVGERLHLSYRRREWATGTFLLLWLIGWTVGCVFLAGMVINDPQLFHIAFAIPFWASWVFVFIQVLKAFTLREEFTLDSEGAVYLRRAIFPMSTRTVPLAEIKRFTPCHQVGDSEWGTWDFGTEMQTLGQPLQFAFGLNVLERTWLQHELNDHLAELKQTPRETPAEAEPADAESSPSSVGRQDRIETLSAAGDPIAPPTDCRWSRDDDFDAIVFRQRGRLDRQSVAGLLFINCFWNGIVGVFVLALCGIGPPVPAGAMWWGMLVFLIPFEVIGLVMFAALFVAVLEPIRTTTWRFGSNSIDNRWAWPGIGRSRTYPIDGLERIELRRTELLGPTRNPLDLRHSCARAGRQCGIRAGARGDGRGRRVLDPRPDGRGSALDGRRLASGTPDSAAVNVIQLASLATGEDGMDGVLNYGAERGMAPPSPRPSPRGRGRDGQTCSSLPSDDGGFHAMDRGQRGGDAFESFAAVAAAPELAGGRAEPDRGPAAVVDIHRVAQHREPGILLRQTVGQLVPLLRRRSRCATPPAVPRGRFESPPRAGRRRPYPDRAGAPRSESRNRWATPWRCSSSSCPPSSLRSTPSVGSSGKPPWFCM